MPGRGRQARRRRCSRATVPIGLAPGSEARRRSRREAAWSREARRRNSGTPRRSVRRMRPSPPKAAWFPRAEGPGMPAARRACGASGPRRTSHAMRSERSATSTASAKRYLSSACERGRANGISTSRRTSSSVRRARTTASARPVGERRQPGTLAPGARSRRSQERRRWRNGTASTPPTRTRPSQGRRPAAKPDSAARTSAAGSPKSAGSDPSRKRAPRRERRVFRSATEGDYGRSGGRGRGEREAWLCSSQRFMPPAGRRSLRLAWAGEILLFWRGGSALAQDIAPDCHPGSGGSQVVASPPFGGGLSSADPFADLLQPVARLGPPPGYSMGPDLRGAPLAAARGSPGGGGVDVYDVEDPRDPQLVATIRIPFPVWDVSLFEQGETTYVALGNEAVAVPQVGAQIWALTEAGPVYASHPSHLGVPENVHHVFVESRGDK